MISKHFSKKISKDQATDTGMALMLVLLLIGLFTHNVVYYKVSIPVLIINMTFPKAYYPIAVVWFGLSSFLGNIVSKVILTIVFLLLVVPVGLVRKFLGKDTLQLTKFKKGRESVMETRNHYFTKESIEKPY